MTKDFSSLIEEHLAALQFPDKPAELYQPIEYALSMGGKRIRPLLVLLACDAMGESVDKSIKAALAVEIFHNFTLLHDDVMDNAPLRRGKPTVFTKWNTNIAILSGDAMFALSLQLLAESDSNTLKAQMQTFLKAAVEVCEGQQMDMNFEKQQNITVVDYIEMIRLKTAVLLASSLQLGAIIGGAEEKAQKEFYRFGENLGIAFQLQDDLLDTYGDPATFGKQIGGDILADKKTYLWLKAVELADANDKDALMATINKAYDTKVADVKAIFDRQNIQEHTRKAIEDYHCKALDAIENIPISEEQKKPLLDLADFLLQEMCEGSNSLNDRNINHFRRYR